MKKYFSLLSIAFLLSACGKEKACEIGGLDLKIINLTPDEDDTITINWYKKGLGFSEIIYSQQLILVDSLDTINGVVDNHIVLSHWQSRVGHIGYLRGFNDYSVHTKSHNYFFSDMFAPDKTQRCSIFPGCYTCISQVTKYKLNGELLVKEDTEPIELEN